VRDHFETFCSAASRGGDDEGLPGFVTHPFRAFLRCRWLAGGFARFRCGGVRVRSAGDPLRFSSSRRRASTISRMKAAAAARRVAAVNADGRFGQWNYAMARKIIEDVRRAISDEGR
jgi:hypothetical protein